MPHLLYHYPPLSSPSEPVPPIPPRTRSRPPSRQQQSTIPPISNHQKTLFFCLDDLPSPDREWQLFENIGDGTYGEVFRVSR